MKFGFALVDSYYSIHAILVLHQFFRDFGQHEASVYVEYDEHENENRSRDDPPELHCPWEQEQGDPERITHERDRGVEGAAEMNMS